MYNLSDFICCILQMKQEFQASFHRSTKFPPTSIANITLWDICFHVQLISKQIALHIFAVDWDTWHVNWVAPCYFSGTSPAGSPRWVNCLQCQLGCEGLYMQYAYETCCSAAYWYYRYQWYYHWDRYVSTRLHHYSYRYFDNRVSKTFLPYVFSKEAEAQSIKKLFSASLLFAKQNLFTLGIIMIST